jgi:hypothetical protein
MVAPPRQAARCARKEPLWRALALAAIALAGCSYTFDDEAPEIPLIGNPPNMADFPRLNDAPVSQEFFMLDQGNRWWIALLEKNNTLRSVRLDDGATQSEVLMSGLVVGERYFYFIQLGKDPMNDPTMVTIREVGSDAAPVSLPFPPGNPVLVPGPADSEFLYWIPTGGPDANFRIYKRDGTLTRTIVPPDTGDPNVEPYNEIAWSSDGKWLYTQDYKNDIARHSTTSEQDVDYGVRDKDWFIDEFRKTIWAIGAMGLQRVPLDGSAVTTLEPTPCQTTLFYLITGTDNVDRFYYLTVDGTFRAVPVDGSGPPVDQPEEGLQRIYTFTADGAPIYTKDPGDRYIYGAGDGWLHDWNFMERGYGVSPSRDGKVMRWLEHAAQTSGSGELLSAPIPPEGQAASAAPPLRLALNVHQASELDDGRVLAVSNRAFIGTQNRVIAIDEQARVATWVANETRSFEFVPGTEKEILCDVVTQASGYDLARVPVPPKM